MRKLIDLLHTAVFHNDSQHTSIKTRITTYRQAATLS